LTRAAPTDRRRTLLDVPEDVRRQAIATMLPRWRQRHWDHRIAASGGSLRWCTRLLLGAEEW